MQAWKQEIEDSPHKYTRKVLRDELNSIYSSIILLTLFGNDVSQEPIALVNIDTGIPYTLKLYQALSVSLAPMVKLASNPVRLCSHFFNRWRLTPFERRVRANSHALRAFAQKQIDLRRSGKIESSIGKTDVLQILLDDQTIFNQNDSYIVD